MTVARVRPIGGLPLAGQLDGSETLPGAQGGASVAITADKLAALAASKVPPSNATKDSVGLGNVANLSPDQLVQSGNPVGDGIASKASLSILGTAARHGVETNGDVKLSDILKIGTFLSSKFASTPDTMQISNLGSFTADHVLNLQHLQQVGPDAASANFNRVSGITGAGATGNLNSTIRIINSVQNGDPVSADNPGGRNQPTAWNGKPYEWGLGVLMENGRTFLADGYRGQNGAAYFRSSKTAKTAGPTWGINVFVNDFPGAANPTDLVQAGEFDVHADGFDANGVRLGVSSNIKSTASRDGVAAGYGEGAYGFTAVADPGFSAITSRIWYAKWTRGFHAAGPMEIAFDAADTSTGNSAQPFVTTDGTNTISSNANTPVAFRSSADQLWCFTKDKNYGLRCNSSGVLSYTTNISGDVSSRIFFDKTGNSAFGTGAPLLVLNGYTTQTVYNNGGSVLIRYTNGVVDFRLNVDTIGFSALDNASSHAMLFRVSNVEGARITTNGRFSTPSNPPASATAPGQAGETAWDGNYEYRCVATNTWKRTPLSTWP